MPIIIIKPYGPRCFCLSLSLSLSPSQWTCQGKPVVQQLIQAQLKCKLDIWCCLQSHKDSRPLLHPTFTLSNLRTLEHGGHTTNSGIHRHKTETVRARNQVFSWIWPPYALWVEQHWIHTLLSHSVLTAGETRNSLDGFRCGDACLTELRVLYSHL